MTQAVLYLAAAPKSNTALTTYAAAKADVDAHGALPVPTHSAQRPDAADEVAGLRRGLPVPARLRGPLRARRSTCPRSCATAGTTRRRTRARRRPSRRGWKPSAQVAEKAEGVTASWRSPLLRSVPLAALVDRETDAAAGLAVEAGRAGVGGHLAAGAAGGHAGRAAPAPACCRRRPRRRRRRSPAPPSGRASGQQLGSVGAGRPRQISHLSQVFTQVVVCVQRGQAVGSPNLSAVQPLHQHARSRSAAGLAPRSSRSSRSRWGPASRQFLMHLSDCSVGQFLLVGVVGAGLGGVGAGVGRVALEVPVAAVVALAGVAVEEAVLLAGVHVVAGDAGGERRLVVVAGVRRTRGRPGRSCRRRRCPCRRCTCVAGARLAGDAAR